MSIERDVGYLCDRDECGFTGIEKYIEGAQISITCRLLDISTGNSVVMLNEPSGEFRSPGYPDLDDDMHCTWKITVPPHHKITLTFLDFELEEVFICKDEVEIYEGDVKKGTYRGEELHQQIITSTSNTISVVLISCSTSLLYDRRGLRVSYSTVYPTTLAQETSNKVTSTTPIIPSTKAMGDTVKATFSSQMYPMFSTDDAPTPSFLTVSSESSGNLVPVILAGLFVSILILIISAIVVVKRRKAKLPSNDLTASIENNEGNCKQVDLSIFVAEGIAVDNSQLEYDYVQGKITPNACNGHEVLDQTRAVFSTKMSFPILRKKQPVFDTKSDVCVYENDTSNVYDNTDFDQDNGTAGCTIQEKPPKVGSNDRQLQRKDSNVNSDEGIVVNSAYEPYISHT
ncbi:Tumor necrosis factor-inducible protein6 protein [Holothuria leucospilota]|uniref:Tumor necrosis factor-inducible protein6 protein n=1 Tax=Holothuria leucospilota TaxID=206669 RepID=A0A9Q1H409_HOLLE|nr:Tumor necrosis factor-inducible protein6 protein [Holothuria leucospilota]